MNVVGVILIVVLAGLVSWLAVDTTIYVVKKIKKSKTKQVEKDNTTEQE